MNDKRFFYDMERDKLYNGKQVIDKSPVNVRPKHVTHKHEEKKVIKVLKTINRFAGKQLKNVSNRAKNLNLVEKVEPPYDLTNEYSWLTPQERKRLERK